MQVLKRQVQNINPAKRAGLEELEKKFVHIENRLGWPAKKRYQCIIGGHDLDTLIVERLWDSLAAMEAAYEKALADPEYTAASEMTVGVIERLQIELYAPLP